MSIIAGIKHLTHYRYDRLVELGPQIIRLRPAAHSKTRVVSHSLKVSPQPHFVNHQQDPYGNWQARYVFPEPVREFKIEVDLVADMTVYNPFDFFVEESAEQWPFEYPAELTTDLSIYRNAESAGPLLQEFLHSIDKTPCNTVDFIVALNARIAEQNNYIIRMEPGVQTPEETLERGSGSCRDCSWLLVQALRHLGLAARFVSGYLIQLKPDLVSLDGPPGTDHDFTDLHAWVEVYLPGAGWVGLDPTSGLLTGESHIPLAATPHYSNAAPISGLASAADVDFSFDMQVERLAEHPRITKPFSEDAWQDLLNLGTKVDEVLAQEDVRLTMGGEPTFVSIDDFESAEWNTAAVGPTKRALADQLIRRLRKRFAPGGFLHYGQGKWYPGESLPRWTFSLYWRKDLQPIWADEKLIATEESSQSAPTTADCGKLLHEVAERIGLDTEFVVEAYEDPAEWLIKEGKLPNNVTAENSKLKDAEERNRLLRVFERGLTEPSSFVLPVQRWQGAASNHPRWQSERWALRRDRVYLVPGDSPAGFRLPIASLPHVPASSYPYINPQDPTVERKPLGDFKKQPTSKASKTKKKRSGRTQNISARHADDSEKQALVEQVLDDSMAVRTAIAAEVRDDHLCVFIPPVETLEDYFELLAAVEGAAETLGLPIHIEGYTPPNDPRINVIRVAPDPGVIEVNIHPAADWQDCVDITEAIYAEARQCRLGTDKFMIDGRHCGTGGGNHVVVGGATTLDSPFLRRPDLLKSLILHWQRHPSLSYLFSGMFIGPTSQAPRIDEARHDSLYELEIALEQIQAHGESVTEPWLVDRLLRNILIDVTGNTHRSEICIDKLYSPDGPTGRLGLVEFRGFEMPPDARMSLAQQVLIRALIARMWQNPISGKPIRWGTRLHDHYMLPEFIWEDFLQVLDDLKDHGFNLRADWYQAQAEFRFPFCGEVEYEGVKLELRQALEPWHVLGETGAIGGTVRYTDSSVERLQAKLITTQPERYAVYCNRRALPLQATRQSDTWVAGVRYKAWQPPETLHPNLPIDAPLVFDVYDKWSQRAIGGCTYHVAHPGGRNYDVFPVNGYEAEARRLARFEALGHTPGSYPSSYEPTHPEFPSTLDLRYRVKAD